MVPHFATFLILTNGTLHIKNCYFLVSELIFFHLVHSGSRPNCMEIHQITLRKVKNITSKVTIKSNGKCVKLLLKLLQPQIL